MNAQERKNVQYASLYSIKYEIWDRIGNIICYAKTFERAIRIMRMYPDTEIIRLSDNVVLAQGYRGRES